MQNDPTFQVFIEGKRHGSPGKWRHRPLTVSSRWDPGGEQEKYEVLAAIRRSYNPENKIDIRGTERQLPVQIGRSEGFSELSYSRAAPTSRAEVGSSEVVIVPGLALYRRLPS
jgi:hypothetical protein